MKTVKLVVFHPELCKGGSTCPHLCERACSKVQYFRSEEGGHKAALRITTDKDGNPACTVCNQCGLCLDICPVLALRRLPTGVITINKSACVGCQACVAFCPSGVMRKAAGYIVPFKCFSCGKCVEACPNKALEVVEVNIETVEREVYARHGRVCP
jgi:anaerobic carbon-monoxide dehydrogenase iron sulfur subunit